MTHDAHRSRVVPETIHRHARIKSDRVSLRTGPGAYKHRVTLCKVGTHLTVTSERDGWAHVALENGRTGWVRHDFVKYSENSRNLTKSALRSKKRIAGAHHAGITADSSNHKHSLSVRHGASTRLAEKKHTENHSARAAAARIRERHQEVAKARLERHAAEVAAAHRRRHLEEIAAARHNQRHHEAAIRNDRHHEQAAAHQRHLDRIAHERHVHRLAEIAAAKHHHHLAEIAAAKHHHHPDETAQARRHRHHEELAAAHHRQHLENVAAAHKKHLANIAAIHKLHLAHIAAAHNRRLAEIAAAHRRHEMNLRHYTQVAYHPSEQKHVTHHIRPEAESPTASTDVVRAAYAYRGTPYRWGQSRPGGFDCSGFTKYVYGRKGVSLPRTAAEQFHAGKAVEHHSMKPGDLVFFHTTRSGISHVGMYVGNGKFVHSSSKKSGGVRVDNLDSGYYNKAFRGARRVQKETTEGSGE